MEEVGYHAYGVTLSSDLRLPELPTCPVAEATWRVVVGAEAPRSPAVGGPLDAPMTVVSTGTGSLLHFAGADFLLASGTDAIEVRPRPGVAASTVRHLLIDHVLPAALSSRGELLLHASGVAMPGGAVLFVGQSGAGKSTLAALLARRGWPVVCDDGARVVAGGTGLSVVPSYPGLRLWPDGLDAVVGAADGLSEVAHDSPKRRWVGGDDALGPLPLAWVCILDDGDGEPAAVPLPPREALAAVLDNSYRLPATDPAHLRTQFDLAARQVAHIPHVRLCYPYDFDRLGGVADLVEGLVAARG